MIRFTVHNSNKLAPTQKKTNNNAGYIFLYGEPRGARARTDVQLHAPGHVCFVGKEEESGKREEMEWYPLGPTTEL
jgi:hypothetical protein